MCTSLPGFCCIWGLALNLVVRCWVSGVVFVDVVLGVEVPHVGSILCRSGCTSWSGILLIRTVGGGVQSWWGVRLQLLVVVQCLGPPVSAGHLPVLV